MLQNKVKLLDSDLRPIVDLYPDQVEQLEKDGLVVRIPSISEVILRLKSTRDDFWTLDVLPEQFIESLKKVDFKADNDRRIARPLSLDDLSDLFKSIEELGEVVSAVVLHPRVWIDFKRFSRNDIDIARIPRIFEAGILAKVWGVPVVVRKDLQLSTYLFVGVVGQATAKIWMVSEV